MMTGMVLLVCCGWTVLFCLSVQAYENLALHKPAWQRSTWRSDTGAELAVDGRYMGMGLRRRTCTASYDRQRTAEWRVDLQDVKRIHHIVIQYVTDNKVWDVKNFYTRVFLGFSVFISNTTHKDDGVLCFRDTNYTITTIPNPVNITCPYHGRYVIYYNNRTHPPFPDGYSSYAANLLCEVEVYGCPSPGFYGENCSLECPQNCKNGHCDIVKGTCVACKPGFMSPRCYQECPEGLYGENCLENCSLTCLIPGRCDKVTGRCLGGCPAGWTGDMCKKECSEGQYGYNCVENCSMTCRDSFKCDKITGHCVGGCQAGWTDDMCDKECAAGLFGNNCVENCSMTCGNPGVCDKLTGHCNGSCLAGWEGDMCQNECSIGVYGAHCLGNCSITCWHPGECDRVTGHCNGGCQRGWTGARCEEDGTRRIDYSMCFGNT